MIKSFNSLYFKNQLVVIETKAGNVERKITQFISILTKLSLEKESVARMLM